MSNLRVVTLGGGTGSSIVLQALIEAGVRDINAISAAMDSGGRTGAIRTDERDRVISVGDLWRTLLSLLPAETLTEPRVSAFREIIQFTDGRRRNVGYSLYYALLEKSKNNFNEVQDLLERLLGVRFAGHAIPVTLEPTTLCFKTRSGSIYYGEHELDRHALSADLVEDLWCDPEVEATPEARMVIKKASHIIYCPGSLHGSLLSNFLPLGIGEALRQSDAQKILITNLVSTRNETHLFRPIDYWRDFSRYTNLKQPFDTVLVPNLTTQEFEVKFPQEALRYGMEHSHFLGWDLSDFDQLRRQGVKVVRGPFFTVTPELHRLRHSVEGLAEFFRNSLISS